MPTELHVTQHMLDEILERLGDDCPSEDRLAVQPLVRAVAHQCHPRHAAGT